MALVVPLLSAAFAPFASVFKARQGPPADSRSSSPSAAETNRTEPIVWPDSEEDEAVQSRPIALLQPSTADRDTASSAAPTAMSAVEGDGGDTAGGTVKNPIEPIASLEPCKQDSEIIVDERRVSQPETFDDHQALAADGGGDAGEDGENNTHGAVAYEPIVWPDSEEDDEEEVYEPIVWPDDEEEDDLSSAGYASDCSPDIDDVASMASFSGMDSSEEVWDLGEEHHVPQS